MIDGEFDAVGSRRQDVLGESARERKRLSVAVSIPAASEISVDVDGPVAGSTAICLVRFERQRTSEI